MPMNCLFIDSTYEEFTGELKLYPLYRKRLESLKNRRMVALYDLSGVKGVNFEKVPGGGKGDMFHVTGELINNNYENNGVKYYSYVVLVNGFTLLPNRGEESKKEESEQETKKGNSDVEIETDDLPFY